MHYDDHADVCVLECSLQKAPKIDSVVCSSQVLSVRFDFFSYKRCALVKFIADVSLVQFSDGCYYLLHCVFDPLWRQKTRKETFLFRRPLVNLMCSRASCTDLCPRGKAVWMCSFFCVWKHYFLTHFTRLPCAVRDYKRKCRALWSTVHHL